MKEETAVELLKLAAQMTEQKIKNTTTRKDQIDSVFNETLTFLVNHLKELRQTVV